MKREDFLDAVGQIDERYIEEAASSKRRVSAAKIIRPLAFLAAAVVLFFGIRFVFRTIRPESGSSDKEIITNADAEGPGDNNQKNDTVPNRTEETRKEAEGSYASTTPAPEAAREESKQGSMTLTEKAETGASEDAVTFPPSALGPEGTEKAESYETEGNTEAAATGGETSGEGEGTSGEMPTGEKSTGEIYNDPGEDASQDMAFLEDRSRDVSGLIHMETADCSWKAEDFLLYLSSSDVMVVSIKAEAYDGTVLEPVREDAGENGIRQLYQISKTVKGPGGLAEGETFAYGLVYDDEGLLNVRHPLNLVYEPGEMSEAMKKLVDSLN
ncbi:MAG: hypothetical protein IJL98_01065 [Lachnospiraceae bacterium]|nr:hypothetical protein [Lachnospiraceae bacterium]